MPKRPAEPVISQTPDPIRKLIRSMIKLLIGEDDHWSEQPYPIKRVHIGMDMQDKEGHILDALEYFSREQIPPTAGNLIAHLELGHRMNVESPREYVEALLLESSEEVSGLRTYNNFISTWIHEQQLAAVGTAATAIANDAFMDYPEKHDAVSQLLAKVSPRETFTYEEMPEPEVRKVTINENERAWQLLQSGQDIGPMFPFEAMKAYITSLKWGEVSLITGKKGTGKSTIAQVLSEYVSWSQRLHCDTCYIALETPLEVLSMRQFARHNNVPYAKVADGRIRLMSDEWKPKWEAWMATCKERANDFGYVRYSYSPGASVHDIIALMTRSSEVSLALGRSIIFIVDHLHSIDWSATHASEGEFGARRAIFELLSAAANKLSVRNRNHLFVFAQEGEEKGMTFGGKFQKNRAQYVFSIDRQGFGIDSNNEALRAPEDYPITQPVSTLTPKQRADKSFEILKADPKKAFLLDATGDRRFWYRKGDKLTDKGSIDMVWSNDNALGKIQLRYESALSKVTQDSDQVIQMRSDGLLLPLGKE